MTTWIDSLKFVPAMTPETKALNDAACAAYAQGEAAGFAGEPCPDGNTWAADGWKRGYVKYLTSNGLALGLVCQGTKCNDCGEQQWGYRAGCGCSMSANVQWGALVDDGLKEGEAAKFMTVEQIKATGLPLIDCFDGRPIPIDGAPEQTA